MAMHPPDHRHPLKVLLQLPADVFPCFVAKSLCAAFLHRSLRLYCARNQKHPLPLKLIIFPDQSRQLFCSAAASSILIKICIYIILYKDSEPLLNAAYLLRPLRHGKFRPAFPFTVKLILHPASSFALSLCQTENRIFPFLSTKIPFLLCISCQTLSVIPLFPLQYPSFFALRAQKSGLLQTALLLFFCFSSSYSRLLQTPAVCSVQTFVPSLQRNYTCPPQLQNPVFLH